MQDKKSVSSSPQETLYGLLRESKYCDVLIDPMGGNPFEEEIKALDSKIVQQCRLMDRLFADSPEQAPYLVRLPLSEAALLEKFLAQAIEDTIDPSVHARTICAFIFSPLEQENLGKRLTRPLSATVQDFGHIYFRYFDPRVMQQLPHILSTEQLAGMLHGVQQWGYVSWSGQFNVIQEPSTENRPTTPAFTRQQWEAMGRIALINATLRTLQLAEVSLTDDADQRIDAQIKAAKMAGFPSTDDQVTYAAYSMKFGEDFTRHPDLAKSVAMTTASKVPLADVLEQKFGGTLQSAAFKKTPDQRASA